MSLLRYVFARLGSAWCSFNGWCDRNPRLSVTLLVVPAIILAAILLKGCVTVPRGPLPPESAAESVGLGAQLESIGGWFVYVGLLAFGLGLVARIAGTLFVPILAPFGKLAGDIAECGLVAALVGGLLVWLSAHLWLVVLACVLTALAWAWYRRAWISRWVDKCTAERVAP